MPPSLPVAVQSLTVSPAHATLSTGAHVAITASPVDANGKPVSAPVKWVSSDTTIAAVSDSGDVLAVAPGNAVITAAAGGAYASAAVTIVKPAPVDSVAVAPQKADLTVGQTLQLAVAIGGQSLTQGVAWESSNAQVASVSTSGLVTGVSAGIASIRATYQGQMTIATVTVVMSSPVPPPTDSSGTDSSSTPSPTPTPTPSGLWTNQPLGFSMVTDQPWNSVTSLGWQEYDTYNHVSVVPDATVPTGDANVLQFYYPAGFSGGGYGPGLEYYQMSKGEVYLGFYWKVSANWQGHTSNVNKMFYLFQREGSNREAVLVVCYGPPGGPYHLEISNEASDGGKWWTQNVNNVPLVPGQWQKIEMHFRKSSSDAAPDGLVEWWVNGKLAARYTNAKLRGANFSEVHIDPVWGGVDNTISKTHADYMWYGHFYVSGR
ncbi:MAG TPA: Ig-like domain-containing protein [Gemmatimonadaceae bacterium]|nr:Ig-like domain-containing protein [Gemmatimonadaceae bacterium]